MIWRKGQIELFLAVTLKHFVCTRALDLTVLSYAKLHCRHQVTKVCCTMEEGLDREMGNVVDMDVDVAIEVIFCSALHCIAKNKTNPKK